MGFDALLTGYENKKYISGVRSCAGFVLIVYLACVGGMTAEESEPTCASQGTLQPSLQPRLGSLLSDAEEEPASNPPGRTCLLVKLCCCSPAQLMQRS